MRWSNRDRDMASRHMSPGTKVGIFLIIIAVILAVLIGGWIFLSNLAGGAGASSVPDVLMAGASFNPTAVAELYGTQTTAVLDGVTQKVQAQNPTEEWLAALSGVECTADNLCTAPAPNSAVESVEDGSMLTNLLDKLGLTGLLGTGGAGILGVGLLYVFLSEDN